uniref:Uncharacterized protein n=1 Tax=uncultured prokaryote TaxID=198431 RepID=A0A0H5Q345_9ZZZZ|nr:hypothetical protein [uncultured prokaryote]
MGKYWRQIKKHWHKKPFLKESKNILCRLFRVNARRIAMSKESAEDKNYTLKNKEKETYAIDIIKDLGELVDRSYEDIDFLKPGFVHGTVGAIVAAGGVGKTFFALQTAIEIAGGMPACYVTETGEIQKKELKAGGVLYMYAEDPEVMIGQRVQSIFNIYKTANAVKEHQKLARKNLKLWPLIGKSPDILNKELVSAIEKAASRLFTEKKIELRLIIFDTLRRFSFADENDGGQMAKVLSTFESLCLKLGCSCLFLHHTSKAAAITGQTSLQQAARGSSVLTDNIRYQEFLAPMTPDEASQYGIVGENGIIGEDNRQWYVRWGVSKQNYGRPVRDMWLQKSNTGVLIPIELEKKTKQSTKKSSSSRSFKDEDF